MLSRAVHGKRFEYRDNGHKLLGGGILFLTKSWRVMDIFLNANNFWRKQVLILAENIKIFFRFFSCHDLV